MIQHFLFRSKKKDLQLASVQFWHALQTPIICYVFPLLPCSSIWLISHSPQGPFALICNSTSDLFIPIVVGLRFFTTLFAYLSLWLISHFPEGTFALICITTSDLYIPIVVDLEFFTTFLTFKTCMTNVSWYSSLSYSGSTLYLPRFGLNFVR